MQQRLKWLLTRTVGAERCSSGLNGSRGFYHVDKAKLGTISGANAQFTDSKVGGST